MAPTETIELEHGQSENKLNENGEEPVAPGGKSDLNNEEEMVTSFIESPTTEVDQSLPRVDEEKRVDCQIEAADQTSNTDPGEGTSSQEKCKSVIINVPEEKPKSERAINGNQEKLVTNNTRAVTTTESPVQVSDDNVAEEKQETASTKNTKRYEIVRWDNKRSCFFVFFLLLFVLWVIAYYLYASEWLYRKINNIRS